VGKVQKFKEVLHCDFGRNFLAPIFDREKQQRGFNRTKEMRMSGDELSMIESSKFKRLTYPDPFGYGEKFSPIFPPRHHAMKAVLDNIPKTVTKVYVFGSAIRWDCAVNSDLDIFLVGEVTNDEYKRIIRAVPLGERVDIIIESEKEFEKNLRANESSLYEKVYERGYKIYERAAE